MEEERRRRLEIEARLELERKLREEQSVILQSMVSWMQGLGIGKLSTAASGATLHHYTGHLFSSGTWRHSCEYDFFLLTMNID